MSGTGGGTHFDFGGGRTGRDEFDCLKYVERVHLSSPDDEVIRTLGQGVVLKVQLNLAANVAVLEAVTADGNVAGSLIPRNMGSLLNCIEKGIQHIAVILDITGGHVKVEIRPGAQGDLE